MFLPRTAFASDSRKLTLGLLRVADCVIVVGAGVVAYWGRHGDFNMPDVYLAAFATAAVLTANYMHLSRLYAFPSLRDFLIEFGTIITTWGAVAVTLLAIGYFTKYAEQYSRVWAIVWFSLTLLGLFLVRYAVALEIGQRIARGQFQINLVVVGAGEYGKRLIQHLNRWHGAGYRVVGVFDPRKSRVPPSVEGHPVLGTVDDLLEYVRKNRVDEIIIALPWRAGAHLQAILMKLKSIAAEVKLCPDAVAFELPILGYDQVVGVPMLKVFERPLSGWGTLVKAAEDRVLAALFLLILSPLFLLIMLLIKLDSRGPVLFRQKRYGFNNDEFTVLKFRTMRVGAVDAGTVPQARRRDPRVTRMGIFLRRTSLDELPQFVNVLRGEMSLVGPRPHAVAHNIEYANLIDEYLGRHRVKPGITGWAQVNGLRGETETPDLMRLRVQHDLYYIENWSLLFDLKVIFLTPFVGMINRNAY